MARTKTKNKIPAKLRNHCTGIFLKAYDKIWDKNPSVISEQLAARWNKAREAVEVAREIEKEAFKEYCDYHENYQAKHDEFFKEFQKLKDMASNMAEYSALSSII